MASIGKLGYIIVTRNGECEYPINIRHVVEITTAPHYMNKSSLEDNWMAEIILSNGSKIYASESCEELNSLIFKMIKK